MELKRIRIKGIAPYDTEQTLELSEVEGPLVAITGGNGAGKSTLLELMHGGLYRRLPTRGKLSTLAQDRDSSLEVTVDLHGRELTMRQLVDAVSGKTTMTVDGVDTLVSGKVTAYDAWAAAHLPSEDVALASLFAAQGSTGFLGAKPSERKSVLLQALGHDRLERISKAARERARDLRAERATVTARLEETAPKARWDEARLLDAQVAAHKAEVRAKKEERELNLAKEARRAAAGRLEDEKALSEMKARLATGDAKLRALRGRVEGSPAMPTKQEADAASEAMRIANDALSKLENLVPEAHTEEIARLRRMQLEAKDMRIEVLRKALRALAWAGEEAVTDGRVRDTAREALHEDTRLEEDSKSAPERIASLEKLAREAMEVHRAALSEARRKAAACSKAVVALKERAALAHGAAEARERLADFEERRALLMEKMEVVKARIDHAPNTETPSVASCESVLEAAQKALTSAHMRVAREQERQKDAEAAKARIASLEKAQAAVDEQLRTAQRVGRDLGRDGLQALELDAAGPELSTLATDLLHRAFGPRWTVTFETLKPSADGKRDLETMEVRVLDTHTGYEGPCEALSGGERAIIGEAVSLALTVVACRAAGLESPTLIRDETGSALDPEKSEAYVRMLRIAAELVGASRVLFVSHDPRAAELADSRVHISDGCIKTEGLR